MIVVVVVVADALASLLVDEQLKTSDIDETWTDRETGV